MCPVDDKFVEIKMNTCCEKFRNLGSPEALKLYLKGENFPVYIAFICWWHFLSTSTVLVLFSIKTSLFNLDYVSALRINVKIERKNKIKNIYLQNYAN